MLALLIMVMSLAAQPASAELCIPTGVTINSATLYIFGTASGQTVNVHRVTAPWTESSVTWNNFMGNYDPAVVGSFVAGSVGTKSVDVTALVQAWVDGTYPNYGLLLEQASSSTQYASSENTMYPLPRLEVCYDSVCDTIQGPEAVFDTYIFEIYPNTNYGESQVLLTGFSSGYEKQTLIWIDICEECIATRTPGYWKNHEEAWPLTSLTLGAYTYTQAELLTILNKPVKQDASIILAHHLIAALLNIANGTDPGPIADAIADANDLLDDFVGPLPYGVRQNTELGQLMVGVKDMLDAYNNGWLTPDCFQ